MFSIENFYYILHQHLLKPLGIHDAMYFPFGSTNICNLMFGRYLPLGHRYGKLRLGSPLSYFFDQEPLNVNSVDDCPFTHFRAHCKLLANSEHSFLKQQILKENFYQDWY
jgi:hypothetical protein